MVERITQSFIKDMRDYFSGSLCGNIVRERWVNDRLLDDPDKEPGSMELGAYFEFLLSGAIPKNGRAPVPQYMPSKIKSNGDTTVGLGIKDMYADYRKAHKAAELITGYLKDMGLKIVGVSVKRDKGRFTGVLDLVCEVVELKHGFTWNVGDKIAIDTKYSGLVGDGKHVKNKHGWQWSNIQKEYHGTQAKQYHMISGYPFYFLVTQSNQEEAETPIVQFFHVPVDEFMIEQHVIEANDLYTKFEFYARITGFEVRPGLNKCRKCPLFKECPDKQMYPIPEVVNLNFD